MGPDMLLAGVKAGRLLRLAVTRNTLGFLRATNHSVTNTILPTTRRCIISLSASAARSSG